MDNLSPQSIEPNQQPTTVQPVVTQTLLPTPSVQPDAPKVTMTDSQVRDLLAINNLQASTQPKKKLPIKLIMAITAMIVLVILADYFIGAVKPNVGSKSSSSGSSVGLPNQADPTSGNGATNQINQDVKACSNPVNALTVC